MFDYEMHMHTKEASRCASSSIEEMIDAYMAIGFSGAVITNHFIGGNTGIDRNLPWEDFIDAFSAPYFKGKEMGEQKGFDLLFGLEQSYGPGEFLVYGIEPSWLRAHPELHTKDIGIWFQAVTEVGGFMAYAHPFRIRPMPPMEELTLPDMTKVHGVEAYNRGNYPGENEMAVRILQGSRAGTAGSDTHNASFSKAFGISVSKRIGSNAELAAILHSKQFSLRLDY